LFYAAEPVALRHSVAGYLAAEPGHHAARAKVLIVPHAGYQYSGRTAAAAYRHLLGRGGAIRRVVLLGPAHRVRLEGVALPSVDRFTMPLGDIEIDGEGREALCGIAGVQLSDGAHEHEHSLEVQLPFLQVALGEFSILPIVAGQCEPDLVAAVIDRVWGGPETLLVISTDLSHFHPYAEAQQIDARTCRRIVGRSTDLTGEEACGAAALNGLMTSHRSRDLAIEQVDLCNSGDTAGDRARVVGYGAFILH
jgi:AmmeMemoRadiSam system protein B